jgi:acetyl esterase/lipase
MLALALTNFLQRRWFGPIWRTVPTVEAMRRSLMRADRIGAFGRRTVLFQAAELNGAAVEWIGDPATAVSGVIVCLHGGGFVVRGAYADRRYCHALHRRTGRPVVMVPYRLAPEHPFPAGLDDCVAVYRGLLETGVPASRIALVGHSAGANYVLALLMRARREGLPQPACAVPLSAPTDMTGSSPSIQANAATDVAVGPTILPWVRQHWLVDTPPDHPDASPLFGAWAGLAPLHFHVSDVEIVFDDVRRAVDKARAAGVDAQLTVWRGMSHNFYYIDILRDAWRCMDQVADFITRKIGDFSVRR